MSISQQQRRRLRGIGHRLKPVVQIGQHGLTESVREEIRRALHDHELIKVQLPAGDPKARRELVVAIEAECATEAVQSIGRIALLYTPNPKPNRKLSNLHT